MNSEPSQSLSKVTKNILNQYGIKLNKNLGQNYLIDRNKRDQIINFANLTKEDVVLEIGTGSGYQAAVLCEIGVEVYSIERYKALYLFNLLRIIPLVKIAK